jgi:hypothetical protein
LVESTYDTISDVRRGAEVKLPILEQRDNFVLLRLDDETDSVDITLYNVSVNEAIDALMGALMAING